MDKNKKLMAEQIRSYEIFNT